MSGRLIIELPTISDFATGSFTLNDVEAIRKTMTEAFEFGKTTCYIGPKENNKRITKTNIASYYNAIRGIVELQTKYKYTCKLSMN